MQLIRHLPPTETRETAVAIGNFDGVHRGHQAVIGAMVAAARAKNLIPSVLTFEPHPRRFFAPHAPAFRLERLATKLMRLRDAGVERLYMPRFNLNFAAIGAQDFLDRILAQSLGARVVVTGEDFAFGKNRGGDIHTLRAWGEAHGIDVLAVPSVLEAGHTCSSSAIRTALEAGDMAHVAELLGRAYSLAGRIVHGAGRGAGLGFATANMALPPLLKLPGYGVYAVRATVHGKTYDAVANLGVKPTVTADARPSLETHLFDFAGDMYGAKITVAFVQKIRDEQKFPGLDALIAQIGHDCAAAKTILQTTDA